MQEGVDIVVVSWHTPNDLSNFIDCLGASLPANAFDLWIFNVEGQKDDILVGEKAVEEFGAHHLISGSNIGYAKAVNRAVALGDRRHIAIFNADVMITGAAIDECVWALEENPDWAILGPKQVNNENEFTHAGIFGTNDAPRHRGWKSKDVGQYDDVREAVTVSGSAYFVKREVWNEMTMSDSYRSIHPDAEGAFLPTQHYYEETFCSYFARSLNYKVIYFGKVKAIHLWHASSEVGGPADAQVKVAKKMFRDTCDAMGIIHD